MDVLVLLTRFRSLWLLAAMVLFLGCSKPPPPSGSSAGSSQGTSANGESEQAEGVESRFIVLSPAIGVMLRDLGFEDSIVGRHSYDNALSESIPVVGSHIEIDYEMLITLDPTDLFFERNTIEIPERVHTLADERGWNLWTYQLETLDDIATTIDDLYLKLVGFPDKGDANTIDLLDIDLDPTARIDVELPSARLARSWSPIGRAATGAGRTLMLAGVDPAGAMGPGSFHAQLIERLGIAPAITDGGMWQELDYEDIIGLAPDSILVFMPRVPDATDLIGDPVAMTQAQINERAGGIATLPIPAAEHNRIAIIEHPLGLLPSSSLAQVADEIAAVIRAWHERTDAPASDP